jgi:hypothetical protein
MMTANVWAISSLSGFRQLFQIPARPNDFPLLNPIA